VSGYPRPSHVTATHVWALAELIRAPVPASSPGSDPAVTGVTHDSVAVRSGDVYAALPGARRHGAEFGAEAVAAGAVAILTDADGAALLAQRGGAAALVPVLVMPDPRGRLGDLAAAVYGFPSARLPVIGITGTAGKTSTAYLIESGLRAAGRRTCMIGTVETRIPDPAGGTGDEVLQSVRTTPEATDLHALLATALERGADAAVMEVSSHALAYGRVGGVHFDVGGWTNFGLDHLDFHADVDDYFAAKARLFDGRCRVELLNLDDPAVRRLVRPGGRVGSSRLAFSADGDQAADWWAGDIEPDGFGQRFTAVGPDRIMVKAGVTLPGGHNVSNALLAIAALVATGIDPAVAAAGVWACPGVPGRLELVRAPGPVVGVVDYAHKPDSIVAALAALRAVGQGRVICVIGAGGDRDRGKRPFMGQAAARGADVVIVTDDNPRTEDPAEVRAAVRAGAEAVGPTGGEVREVPGRREAIAAAVALARPGDVVALLGKGHERGQEVAGATEAFDDRVELARALTDRFGGTP
jgi:UDP-N-acetylmuramoyl-L-alanyl-D-glutamate--2,6-diaminopimelate ligase